MYQMKEELKWEECTESLGVSRLLMNAMDEKPSLRHNIGDGIILKPPPSFVGTGFSFLVHALSFVAFYPIPPLHITSSKAHLEECFQLSVLSDWDWRVGCWGMEEVDARRLG